ncbi:HAD family hydrolase [Tuanshanicoccus lijuaniae]|uniref:HAD family hydrolase n=1 Tax=Aerococcaceae bacterium zg-1292 TaxID=2774330 RepID=UPI001BD88F75|nr:HAD family hydrolase [Aerococcaceae bacterium zg-A91]MBS4457388.1 HAD family hydrolase [Aerococcaceae bacterium zg-BR33]
MGLTRNIIEGILFDKDGTLIRLDDLWVEPTLQFMEMFIAKHTAMTADEKEQFYHMIGIENQQLVANGMVAAGTIREQATALARHCTVPVDQVEAAMTQYFTDYLHTHPEKLIPVTDLTALFTQLKAKGYGLGLVTADSHQPTMVALELLGIADYFSFIAAADDKYALKPHPEALHAFAQSIGAKATEVVYVGDSIKDMQFGQHGYGAIGVLSGNTAKETLLAHTDCVIDSIEQLPLLLDSLD